MEPEKIPNIEPSQEAAPRSEGEHSLSMPAGTRKVHLRVEVPEGTCLEVNVEAQTPDGRSLGYQSVVFGEETGPVRGTTPPLVQVPARRRLALLEQVRALLGTLVAWLFWLSISMYAITRLVALPDFPIYFFTDEAIQTVQAADFLRDRFHSITGELLPTYFENGSQYNLSASVYFQILPYFLLGKSIWVTRGAAALATILSAVCVGLTLKRVFKSPYPWLAVLFLAITPAWFLHSRTAFETGLATTFYAAFLYTYMVYRAENPRYLFAAAIFAALTFYSYTPARVVVLVTALLLFVSDLGYHLRHWRLVLPGFLLALLLALPFARFWVSHPDASQWQMRLLGSYWLLDIPLQEKLATYTAEYLRGLDPFYWYLPHNKDLPRHTMLNYGHLLRQTLPLGLAGVGLALYRLRSSPYRTLLIAVLAAPTGAALVKVGITRVLIMVVPMALLTALAASEIMEWLHRRKNFSHQWMSLIVFILLAGGSLYMLRDALVNGPYWYSDYGLTGQQYGARQVFGEIKTMLREPPEEHIILSPSWANGTDVVARFFFPDPIPFELGSPVSYFDQVRPLDEKALFVMIPEEYASIPHNRFSQVQIEKTLFYPDGRPGFYFVRMKYVENIEEVMAEEELSRLEPEMHIFPLDGQKVTLHYSKLDMGQPRDLFDGNPNTLVRSWAINPMILDVEFDTPRETQSASLWIGGSATTITVQVWGEGWEEPVTIQRVLVEAPRPREAVVDFGSTIKVRRVRIEVLNTHDTPEGHVHLWEVTFKNAP